ncbi:hypothetical protein LTR54_018186 [Friedmanniomyces endolithicus]|nr:hypothetical protein LTR54_018186 [Friedmanniomyces endolithicus]
MTFLANEDRDILREDYTHNTAVHYAIKKKSVIPDVSTREDNIHEDLTLVVTLRDRWQTLGKPKLYTYCKDFFLLAISRWDGAFVSVGQRDLLKTTRKGASRQL